MTTEQKVDAVKQMVSHCRLLMEQKDYEVVSARGVLYTLGFEEVEEVLAFIAEGGFDYCLDEFVGNYPPRSACYWGADQLESRLQCLSNVRVR